jgi:hypothetical protein
VLSYLLWEIHNYPSHPVTVEIENGGYRVIQGWRSYGDPMPEWKPLSEAGRSKVEDALEQVVYWKWERSYFDPDICDGTTWSIKVRGGKTGGRRKNCSGVNGFPEGWDKVQAVIMELVKKP